MIVTIAWIIGIIVMLLIVLASIVTVGPTAGFSLPVAAGFILAIIFLFLLPISGGGLEVLWKLVGLLNKPMIGNSIPIWLVFIVFLGLLIWLKKSRRRVVLAPQQGGRY